HGRDGRGHVARIRSGRVDRRGCDGLATRDHLPDLRGRAHVPVANLGAVAGQARDRDLKGTVGRADRRDGLLDRALAAPPHPSSDAEAVRGLARRDALAGQGPGRRVRGHPLLEEGDDTARRRYGAVDTYLDIAVALADGPEDHGIRGRYPLV